MLWIVATLAGVVVAIIIALSMPLYLKLHMDAAGRPRFRMSLTWLFGLLRKDITRKEKRPEGKEKVLQEKRKSGGKRPRARVILEILRARGLLRQIKILVKDILRLPRIKDLEADLTVGLGDPADTGLLFALIGPATSFLSPSLRNEINVQPSFANDAILEGSLYGTLRLRPIRTITPLLRFIFSLPALRAAKILVVTKWKGNK
ncbi:DUF2953 domain-containing protein [Chloroflexota bacterium]